MALVTLFMAVFSDSHLFELPIGSSYFVQLRLLHAENSSWFSGE
jgi:hypothetical protein